MKGSLQKDLSRGDSSNDSSSKYQQQQFEAFKTNNIGLWRALWQTYNAMGDVEQESKIAVDVYEDMNANTINIDHLVTINQIQSDCETCHDSVETKTMPVARLEHRNLRRHVIVGSGHVNGPNVLRSGSMSTELCLRHGDGRMRVTVQHAPVWKRGSEQTGVPDGLKIFRVIVARECLRDGAPTPDSEAASPPQRGNPTFWRGVSPFKWHAVWKGKSNTWGQINGVKAWEIESLEEGDAWHGRPRGDNDNTWTLRLQGGVLLQVPQLILPGEVECLRVAWLPEDDILKRIEARVVALQQSEELNDQSVLIEPPKLLFLRVDDLQRAGNLPEIPVLMTEEEWLQNSKREG
ncbi:hypothetical protein GUITHDRAFT_85467 [Guillardia theta CCMP2712]|uniref:DUF3598 domain-containing protein n=2 Tax=Guillardia theta TaxID=55529 RepID=L1JQG1_GUITC|nr:hypothetical protein GUITHDRAFT_85467 [Guillardia theta CCMP2712]EKX50313.1 hypothetical protein GUITHDRAFT_85467 [Guillardia theta CCMP2712]|eukprot:XP_005837293.1 hypothetical protein GUITHDRAFT_85467 [Guillardia theta CCMP2712]